MYLILPLLWPVYCMFTCIVVVYVKVGQGKQKRKEASAKQASMLKTEISLNGFGV